MGDSWPSGVTTQDDMHRYAKTLFGNCKIENLLTGTPFDGDPECLCIRVKDICSQGNWKEWPNLMEEAMMETVATYRRPEIIQVKAKAGGPLEHTCMTRCR